MYIVHINRNYQYFCTWERSLTFYCFSISNMLDILVANTSCKYLNTLHYIKVITLVSVTVYTYIVRCLRRGTKSLTNSFEICSKWKKKDCKKKKQKKPIVFVKNVHWVFNIFPSYKMCNPLNNIFHVNFIWKLLECIHMVVNLSLHYFPWT